MKRVIVWGSCLLMVAGLVVFWRDGRIFSTFLLEIVVGTIGPGPAGEIPAHEFSWGVKSFGNMNAELARAAIGALAMTVGYFLLLPGLVSAARGTIRVRQFASSGLVAVSGLLWVWVAISFLGSFRVLAMSGAVDPVAFGEDLPIRTAGLARLGLVVGMGLMAVSGIATEASRDAVAAVVAPGRRLLARFSGVAALGFGGCLMSLAFGPLTGALSSKGSLSPVVLADQIQASIFLLGFAGGSLLLAGGLGIVATALPAARAATPADER